LESVGAELKEENLWLGIMGQVVVERQVIGHSQNRIRDCDIAGLETGIALDNLRIDARHGSRIAEDQDITVPVCHLEDGIVRAYPDAGTVMDEKVGTA
jgi:hypothetical protein